MRDRYELVVPGEVDHIGALRVLIDAPRCLAVPHQVDRRPLFAPRPPQHGEARSQDQTRAVGRLEGRREERARATTEWLSNVVAELVSFYVVEPPDALS